MRNVIAVESVSLDGVMESPEEWAPVYSTDEMEEMNASAMAASDALLLGRVTYEGLAAFWPNQPDDDPIAEYINNVPKYVVSTTVAELEWNNSTLINGNVAEEITKLKRQSGKDIGVIGSGALVRSLLRDELLNELQLSIYPIILGSGKRLFEGESDRHSMELVDSKTFDTGVISLTYRPEGQEGFSHTE